MKLGIIQGRLTVPKEGHQTTPKNWEHEFKLLNKLSLNHIEWNLNKEKLFNNPIFKNKVNPVYLNKISSVCFDNAVSEYIFDHDLLISKEQFFDETSEVFPMNSNLSIDINNLWEFENAQKLFFEQLQNESRF